MTGRREERIRAYRFIQEKLGRVGQDLSSMRDKTLTEVTHISLRELAGLGEGVVDPSRELVAGLKQVLQGRVSEAEIDEHLVAPFLSEA